MKTKIVSFHTADSKPVKQEVNGTVILPPLVFPDLAIENLEKNYKMIAQRGARTHDPEIKSLMLYRLS
jgi:hypothetical protein